MILMVWFEFGRWTKVIHVAIEEKFISIESSEGDGVIDCTIKVTHFQQAVSLVSPSVSKQVTMLFSLFVFTNLKLSLNFKLKLTVLWLCSK